MKNDKYEVWDGEKFVFTLNKVFAIGGTELPRQFEHVGDIPIAELSANLLTKPKEAGLRVLFITTYEEKNIKRYKRYINEGAVIISAALFKDESGNMLPYIRLSSDKLYHIWQSIGLYIKKVIQVPTIGITGSVGKTTATSFMKNIFSERGKVFVSGGNLNVWDVFISQMIKRFDDSCDYHIQEVGGGRPGLVEESAKVLNADAYCITNILPHHLNNYKSIDGIIKDKTSFDRKSKEDAFAVVNVDDKNLKNFPFKCRVITCGIKNVNADYVASDICQNGMWLDMKVCFKDESVPVRVNIPGRHNAYNVLFAFAMAKEFGFSNQEIKNGLLKYKSDPIRQSVREISGRTLYVDCFNICAESINSSLETLEQLKRSRENKTIAILGGENALGEKAFSVNYEAGLELGRYNIDEFVFLGLPKEAGEAERDRYGDAYALYKGAKRVIRGKKISYHTDLEDVADMLAQDTKPGDAILIKGIIHRPFFPMIDMAFGTSYSHYNQFTTKRRIEDNTCIASYCENICGANILKYKNISGTVKIPNLINGLPVYRIGKEVFAFNESIITVDFGKSVVNVGAGAFKSCKNIEHLNLPENIKYIEESAFEDCSNLSCVILAGVEHIEKNAFRGCKNLKNVVISGGCATIEEGAFEGADNIIVTTQHGSYAEEYAHQKGLTVEFLI